MSNITKESCPSCGAPIQWPLGEPTYNCPFCNSQLTKNDTTIIAVDKDHFVLDSMTIDQLKTLQSKIETIQTYKVKFNAHKLLMDTLGDNYEAFIKNKQVQIQSNDKNKYFIIHINGYVEEYEMGIKKRDGQLYRSGYPAQDALVTFIHYAKSNVEGLENLWGCGNIVLKGGEVNN